VSDIFVVDGVSDIGDDKVGDNLHYPEEVEKPLERLDWSGASSQPLLGWPLLLLGVQSIQ
jgi:hypothetical protein